jgi:hypothetical protein
LPDVDALTVINVNNNDSSKDQKQTLKMPSTIAIQVHQAGRALTKIDQLLPHAQPDFEQLTLSHRSNVSMCLNPLVELGEPPDLLGKTRLHII